MLEACTAPIRLKVDHVYLPDDPILRNLRASPDFAESVSGLTLALPRARLHELDIARFGEIVRLCDQLRYLTIESGQNVLYCVMDGGEETRVRLPVESANTYRVHGWTMKTKAQTVRAQLDAIIPAVLALADPASQAELGFRVEAPIAERIVHRGSDALVLRLSDPSFARNITSLVLGSSVSGPVRILDLGYLGRAVAPFEPQFMDALTEAELPNLERLQVETWATGGMFLRAITALVRKNVGMLRTLALPAGRLETQECLEVVLGVTNRALRTLILDISLEPAVNQTASVNIEQVLRAAVANGGLRGLRKLELRHSHRAPDHAALRSPEWQGLRKFCRRRRVVLCV